ncbi:hypothetical protein Tco_0252964 [Tanacetum coccineum]
MMTARKKVGSLPTHRLAVRHSIDYSPSYHFSSDDSSSSSSSETSSDSSADALSDSASRHSSSDHSLPVSSSGMRSSHRLCSLVPSVHRSSVISERPSHDSSFASLSRKRSRYPVASIPLSSSIPGALFVARADLLPSPKRIRSLESATDLEGCLEDSFEPYTYRASGVDVRVEVVTVARDMFEREGAVEGIYETLGDLVQMFHDHTVAIPVHRVQAIESIQSDQGHRIMATRQQSADMLERIKELERDNRRLRDIVDVES